MPKSRRRTPVKKPSKKSDGWGNALTGVGAIGLDKRRYARFNLDIEGFVRENQEEIWEGCDISARCIELVPNEMMRGGFEFTISDSQETTSEEVKTPDNVTGKYDAFPPPAGAAPPDLKPPPQPVQIEQHSTKPVEDAVMGRYEELHGPEIMLEALMYRRAYGGAAIFPGAIDGSADLTKPLNLDRIRTFQWANVFTPRELQAVRYYADPRQPKYGQPEIFRIVPDLAYNADMSTSGPPRKPADNLLMREIHESRLIIFPGITVSKRHRYRRHGWGDSILVRLWQVICDFNMSYGAAAHLITDFAQAILKIKGLAELIATNDDEALAKRAQLIDMTRSVAKAIILDAEEDFERKSTSVTGLPELLMRFEHRLAAAAGMPVSVLMGREPSGLNASGDSEMEQWYNTLAQMQEKDLRPQLERFLRLIMLSKDGPTNGVEPENWSLEFEPLMQPDESAQADIRLKQAQADQIYINAGVVLPEEIAQSRFGGRKWSAKTSLDNKLRQKAVDEHQKKQEENMQLQKQALDASPPPAPAKPLSKPLSKPPSKPKAK